MMFAGINGFGTMYVLKWCTDEAIQILPSEGLESLVVGCEYTKVGSYIKFNTTHLAFPLEGHTVYSIHITSQRQPSGPKSSTLTGYLANTSEEALELLLLALFGKRHKVLSPPLVRRMRLLRTVGWVCGRLLMWHMRAAARTYAPGGLGYDMAKTDFEECATALYEPVRTPRTPAILRIQ